MRFAQVAGTSQVCMGQGEVFAVIRRGPTMVLSWVGTAGSAAASVWLVFSAPDDAGFWYLFQGFLALWLIAWFVWLCGANPRLVVTEGGVDVTNYLLRYWIPRAAVARVETTDRTVICLTDGRRVKPAVGEWSLAGRLRVRPVPWLAAFAALVVLLWLVRR